MKVPVKVRTVEGNKYEYKLSPFEIGTTRIEQISESAASTLKKEKKKRKRESKAIDWKQPYEIDIDMIPEDAHIYDGLHIYTDEEIKAGLKIVPSSKIKNQETQEHYGPHQKSNVNIHQLRKFINTFKRFKYKIYFSPKDQGFFST